MTLRWPRSLEQSLGARVVQSRPLAGGDICQVEWVALETGEQAVIKSRSAAPPGMFRAEARGLDWLREAEALRLPRVLTVGDDFLALEYLAPGARAADFEQALGRGLAALHRATSATWGLDHDNFIGPLSQANQPCAQWAEFYLERRLRPQVQRALASGRAPAAWADRFAALTRLAPAMIAEEPPARLHGDLWSGNVHVGPGGEPCLIDPAAYAGHREVDLAMMRLFGGFGPMVFESYEESYPLSPGAQQRVPLYQLYPLLVHFNLFGTAYQAPVSRALAALLELSP